MLELVSLFPDLPEAAKQLPRFSVCETKQDLQSFWVKTSFATFS